MDVFQILEQELSKLPPTANERSLYTPLNNFLKEYANSLYKVDTYSSIAEESGYSEEKHIGFPDLTLRNKEHAAGWVEVKNPGEPLDGSKHLAQFTRYKNSFENLIITNMQEWQLWQWDSNGNSTQVKYIKWDPYHQMAHGTQEISELLQRFLEGTAHEVRIPKQLAIALARKTQVLRDQVIESYQKADDDSQLAKLKNTFESTLIQNISDHQFANMVAETVAYSLFLARLEYEEKPSGQDFSIEIVRSFLPKNVPVLRDLYEIVLRVAQEITPIDQAIGLLVDQLNAADIERIRHKLTEHKPGEDPVIQFYEPFLNAYDPKEREARGVYYTPKPLVDYIVRGVDHILKTSFDKKLGLADTTVQILDPATGSGTFLMSAVQQVHYNLKQTYGGLGDEELERRFRQNVLGHILKHFYGFELLMAPYAVAHLKLTLELERMGFNWSMTDNDGDNDNNRFKVYLANSLDDPNQPPKLDLPGFHIAEESNKAMEVKNKAPIIVVLGNPPYSGHSSNVTPYAQSLIQKYKTGIPELKRPAQAKWLSDDYVKFISYAEQTISSRGQGLVAFVTNHAYLNNPTFRGMRLELIKTFDELYVFDLHGNAMKSEKNSEADKDENVFGIQQGVCIIFAIKKGSNNEFATVHRADLYGKKAYKFSFLNETILDDTPWHQVSVYGPKYLFENTDRDLEKTYELGIYLPELFDQNGRPAPGMVTTQDDFAISLTAEDALSKVEKLLGTANESEARSIFKLCSQDQWVYSRAMRQLTITEAKSKIKPVAYRPFDNRYTVYDSNVAVHRRDRVMKHLINGNNIGLATSRQTTNNFQHIFIVNRIAEFNLTGSAGKYGSSYIFPLYLYPQSSQITIDGSVQRKPNLNNRIINAIADKLKITWISDHENKDKKDVNSFSPLDINDYIYAVLHSPKYREKYNDFLKSDFPRVPFPSEKDIFWKLVALGSQLRGLHQMGDDPFGSDPEILRDSEKWRIQPRGQRDGLLDWKVEKVEYEEASKRVYVNDRQYFEGIEPEIWNFHVGGYQVMDKWLKDRKKTNQNLTTDDRLHYVKIAVVLRETIRIQKEIDATDFMDQK